MPQIRVISGLDQPGIIPLEDQEIVIGRDPGCDLVLDPNSPASRRHASLYQGEGGWHIRDLGSSNGTSINGASVEDRLLEPGDQVTLATLKFIYEENFEEAPEESAESEEPDLASAPVAAPVPVVAAPRVPSPVRAPAAAASANAPIADARIEAAVRSMSEKTRIITAEIGKAIIGQTDIIAQLLTAIISNGHVLMIGMPGLAKTMLIRTVSEVLDLEFRRVQFTPDLMPSDITGTDILESDEATGKKEYRFIRGPIFTNILLADEINRTPPKTQAALLEAMQEHRVTAAGQTMTLTPPFFVLATQNPLEQEGTYPLPEAQLDRFMFSIYVDYPPEEDEATIAKVTTRQEKIELRKVLTGEEILELQHAVRSLPISDHVVLYATRLVRATRPGDPRSPDFIKKWIHAGAGVRASQYLVVAAKARAVTAGRLVVTCDDVRASARPILRHRMFTNFTADSEGMDTDKIVQKLIEAVPEPGEKDYAGKR